MLLNGQPCDTLSVYDRGLSYGDGLFETIRFVGARAPLWARHMHRLQEGCQRLGLASPDLEQLWREAQRVSRDLAQSVVKIVLTRGVGERGYAVPRHPAPTRIVMATVAPRISEQMRTPGIRTRICQTRLAEQPLLAGIKHLNRLEQVLARAEWHDPAVAEGLLLDMHGHVVSATAANLFAVVDGVLATPPVDRCGVAGVGRAEVLAALPQAQVRELSLQECLAATELFLSSSVRGILPIHAVDDTVYGPGPVARSMQAHWRGLGFFTEQA